MSKYDELVKILRDGGWRGAEAADAIEALVGERDLWKSDADRQRQLREDDRLEVERLKTALEPFAAIKADDGDTFDTWNDGVIIRCEITVGDLKKARSALEAKP